jgi:hypothetical protein
MKNLVNHISQLDIVVLISLICCFFHVMITNAAPGSSEESNEQLKGYRKNLVVQKEQNPHSSSEESFEAKA